MRTGDDISTYKKRLSVLAEEGPVSTDGVMRWCKRSHCESKMSERSQKENTYVSQYLSNNNNHKDI